MHILLTRPINDVKELIIKFKSLGHDVSHLPVIKISKKKFNVVNYSDYSGIIFTSANAVEFLDTKHINKNIHCFCVGAATENKALKKGFQNVYAAEGNVENLKEIHAHRLSSLFLTFWYGLNSRSKNLCNKGTFTYTESNYASGKCSKI